MPGTTAHYGWQKPLGTDLASTGDNVIASGLDAADTTVFNHISAASAAHAASAVSFTPTGLIVATNVQAALAELDTKKAPVAAFVKKAASTIRTATTTLADDPHLTIPIVVGQFYDFKAFVVVNGPAAADFQFQWTVPTGAVSRFSVARMPTTAASMTDGVYVGKQISNNSPDTAGTFGTGATGQVPLLFQGFVYNPAAGGTAGNLTLQWAQNTSDPGNTTVAINSYIVLTYMGTA